jgi:hypothetical protein
MARKRLGGPLPDYLEGAAGTPAPQGAVMPIAQVAGETAALAAFAQVADELAAARAEGRMVLALPLHLVAEDYLIRDRISFDRDEMESLKASLMARGQQTPVEVAETGGGRYGLISGARRLTALRELQVQTGEARFGTVLALLRRPEAGADPYVAMVEENEIRVGLSFYERARIVMRAMEAGVYPTEKKALQGLFAAASFAKRSKVKSFIPVVAALDGALRFPARIPERLGLRLAKALEAEPGFGPRAVAALEAVRPATAEAEARVLTGLLRPDVGGQAEPEEDDPVLVETWSDPAAPLADLRVTVSPGQVVIEGPGVDAAFAEALRGWIAARGA